MIDPKSVPAVDSTETLARFILFSNHIRAKDNSIKPDAFLPHPYKELSVMRHRDATTDEIWQVGRAIACMRRRVLHGCGDIAANESLKKGLSLHADPILNREEQPDNPNHALVSDWPEDKAEQRLLALEIASLARLKRPSC